MPIESYLLRFLFYNSLGSIVADANEYAKNTEYVKYKENYSFTLKINSISLKPGKYHIGFGLIDTHGDIIVWSHKQRTIRIAGNGLSGVADYQMKIR